MRSAFFVCLMCLFTGVWSSCTDKIRPQEEQEAITLLRNEMVFLNQQDSVRQQEQEQIWERKIAELKSRPDTINTRYPIYGLNSSLRGYRLFEKILGRLTSVETAIKNREKSNPIGVVNLTTEEVEQLEKVENETGSFVYLYHQEDGERFRKDTTFYFGSDLVARNPQKNWITQNINRQPLAVADLFFVSLRRKLYATRQEFINRAVSHSGNY